jgi:hypothetical protein
MLKTCISEISDLVGLISRFYASDNQSRRDIQVAIYASQTKIRLIVGRSTTAGIRVCEDLDQISAIVLGDSKAHDMEACLENLRVHFDAFLLGERIKIKSGR